jgi:hypothetical protein
VTWPGKLATNCLSSATAPNWVIGNWVLYARSLN